MKKLIALASVLAILGMTGCNTMQGFGKDVEKTGEGVEKAAKKAQ